jgi:hypothetical protein
MQRGPLLAFASLPIDSLPIDRSTLRQACRGFSIDGHARNPFAEARLSAMLAAQVGEPAPGLGALSIANCKAYAVREPVSGREYAILRIETASGIVGWGETHSIASSELARAAAVLRGRQATEFGPLHAQLAGLSNLQAAANMALLGIVGQAAKAPVYSGPGRLQCSCAPSRSARNASNFLIGVRPVRNSPAASVPKCVIPAAVTTICSLSGPIARTIRA